MFKYAKAWTAVTTAALVLLGAAVGLDSTVYTVAVTIIGALGVFFIPNTPTDQNAA